MSQAMVRQAKETEGTLALNAATLLAPFPMLILMWQALTRVGSEQTCFLAFLSSFDIQIFTPVVPTQWCECGSKSLSSKPAMTRSAILGLA